MAKTPAIGHTACPVCPQVAEVKRDKSGRAYIFCPDCNIQLFTRYEHQSKFLLAKMTPLQGATAEPVEAEPAAATVENNPPPIKKGGFNLGDL
jgi:hypothetical protein